MKKGRIRATAPCLSYLTNCPSGDSARKALIRKRFSVRYVPAFGALEFLRTVLTTNVLLTTSMPASRSRKHSSPINVGKKSPHQVNGLYVHSSPPRVLQVHSSIIRQWLRAGDMNQLEQLVLEGQGHKLVGEYSPDPKVRSFLRQIPAFLLKTKKLHGAVAKGDLKQVQKLLSGIRFGEPPMKNIHLTKNQGGLTLLHKAVYYGHPHVVEYLASNFPQSIKVKDSDGKTPLHYCGASKDAGKIWPILIKAGADASAPDSKGRQPAYYMERSNEIQLPEEEVLSGTSQGGTSEKNGLIIKPSNIRIWIHDRDIGKLRQVIWEGHGAKLRVETSKHPKVKRFLEGVPYILNIIKDVHSSVVNNDLEEFLKKSSDPVPPEVLDSKDVNGLTPLHKAAGLNRRKIAENILKRAPNAVFSVDKEGKTPLHYAAVLRDDGAMYNLLMGNHANEIAVDKNGKTASYYKANPKEIVLKMLETIPEAPRTSATFPQAFDWSLFHPDGTSTAVNPSPGKRSSVQIPRIQNHNDTSNSSLETESKEKKKHEEDLDSKKSDSEEKSSGVESENVVEEEGEEEETNDIFEESPGKLNFDIWTNNADDGVEKQEASTVFDDVNSGHDDEEKITAKEEETDFVGQEDAEESTPRSASVYDEVLKENEMREKTEREIAEERQRLLDEGLLRIQTDDETEIETETGDAKVNAIIEAGDMEKLAAMVLNGEGNKLQGKTSTNPEVQNFLDNTPTYMTKITAVHKAARDGSLKDLQAALDRRKFAIAKESSDKSGATPLHAAVIFENTPVVKYLGGRFPETLTSKDKLGRTPLHYAALLRDEARMYATLINLGADPEIKDDEGHTAAFYQNSSSELTREKLLEEMSLSNCLTNERLKNSEVSSPVTDPSIHDVESEISFDEGIPFSKNAANEVSEEESDSPGLQSNFSLTDRDEYGQSVLHFAAARAHGRGGLFQLIHESGVNLGYRDELYRTARDIAQQANIPENINEIDKYVISLAAKGETGKLVELFLEGYDHILDLEDDEDVDIMTIALSKSHDKTAAFLKAIPGLEEKRENIHRAVRAGNSELIETILSESKNGRFLIMGKNTSGRCSLHLAVLCQQKAVTEFIAQKFPETLKIGDNLERTSLHYAMGVEDVESLSKILIKCGAKRVVKDLKGRQPTYYFMNKTEILKLQEDENVLSV